MSSARKLRGAVVGFGFISGKGHVPAYLERARRKEDVEIVAVADLCEGRLAAAGQVLPHARLYRSYLEMLESEAGALDFVDIATPPASHMPIARAALEKGCHVLCEKPLATRAEDAAALLQTAIRERRVIFPCHNYKHAPVVRAVTDLIRSEAIGKVRSVSMSTFRSTHARGVPEWNPDWRRDPLFSGGGIAMDHGSHSFYLLFDWMGGFPETITARAFNWSAGKYATEDNLSATLGFAHGWAHVQLSWTAGVRKVIYGIQGERGAIVVDDDDLELSLREGDGWNRERRRISSHWMDASHVHWFDALFERFQRAIQEGEYAGTDAREALRCIQVIEGAYRSSREGSREIRLDCGPENASHRVVQGDSTDGIIDDDKETRHRSKRIHA